MIDQTTATTVRPRVTRRGMIAIASAIVLWAGLSVVAIVVGRGIPPLPLPALQAKGVNSVFGELLSAQAGLPWALVIMGVVYLLTARCSTPDLAARAPSAPVARAETLGLVVYAVAAQAVGYGLGHVVGHYAISLHMPGTLYGLSGVYTPVEAIVWMVYNFVVYAAVPYLYFRRRGYTREQLNLTSANLRSDLLVIAVVFVIESAAELLSISSAIFSLSGGQLALGALLAFVLNFFGTVLPCMIFIYSLLLPRYLKLTGSVAITILLGGLTYALLHTFDGWTNYGTLGSGIVSFIVVLAQYVGPGMAKSVMTLRTGNAWVHVWAYHAIDPHVTIDTPTIVGLFGIK